MYLSLLFYITNFLVIIKLYIKLTTGWCRSQVCLKEKTAIVTGANTGIGYETALDLAKRGARVILACRNETKAQQAQDAIIRETHNEKVVYKLVDFTSLESVKKFAEDIKLSEDRLDILVNNAGMYSFDNETTDGGVTVMMQVNYLAPVLLTELLLDLLKKTSGRIVNVSSMYAKYALYYDDLIGLNRLNSTDLYYVTKLWNILYTIELAARLDGTGVTTYSVHPGIVRTEIGRYLTPVKRTVFNIITSLFCKNKIEGAQTSIYCAVENRIEKYSGEHFHDCHVVARYTSASCPHLVKAIWKVTKSTLQLD